ncbi:MAG: TonB-dependent receptor plug domain-containing protein [Prevotella sp.]|nr:TonB-dependent receptor plug domain-containing protein [Prevotella sp.]
MRKIIFILLLLGCVCGSYAQEGYDQYRIIYDNAEENYNIGRLDEAEKELTDNIKKFPSNLRQSAYRLLALCSLGNDEEKEAEERVRLLLQENPYFSPSANDPQRFIDMVENIKSGLNATITTASSQAENLNEVPVPTTLITEEMIRNSSARNLQEVLAAYVPGMTIVDCNDDINIAMRGIYSNGQEKILIMLNGHRLNSFATNIAAPDFSINLDKVRQIEVLRGPASSLYGGVSLTAVVNVITKQGADVDGVKAHAGIGTYGQIQASLMLGKRYFDLDVLVWGSLYKAKGQKFYMPLEDTGMQMTDGDITVGGVGPKPSYDIGIQLKYKNLQFLYNTTFSQIISPMTMFETFSPYQLDKYRTFNGIGPSFTTRSHHADLSYGQQLGKIYLKGTITYDNSDLTHYQVINDPPINVMTDVLPIPDGIKELIRDHEGISRYINGQENTIGGKLQGDWSYVNNDHHKGLFSFGAEFSYFQLDDARYVYGYDFTTTTPESYDISNVGKGHESNFNGFAQLKHQWNSFILNAGLRFDYKNRYNDSKIRELSPRVALIFVQPKWNLKLSYSKAFIDAPYLYRKTNLILATYMGYKELADELSPESLHSFQLTFGATQWLPGLNFELNAFYNRARDLIFFQIAEHLNTGNINTYGLELSASYNHKRFSAHLNTTWQKVSKSEFFTNDDKFANNIPEISANAVFAWKPIKNLTLHTHIDFQGKQHSKHIDILQYAAYRSSVNYFYELWEQYKEAPTDELKKEIQYLADRIEEMAEELYVTRNVKARILFDLGAHYKWGNLEFGLNVKNIFNTHYYQSGMSTGLIPQRGRWLMFDIAYKF